MFIQKEIEITISDKGFYDITSIVNEAVSKHRIQKGLCSLFIKHTSASLTRQENADPRVLKDLSSYLKGLVPEESFCSINESNRNQYRTKNVPIPYCYFKICKTKNGDDI